MKRFTYIPISVLSLTALLFGAERPGAVFLMISPGARAVSMGSAFTGLCDDPSLLWYNPGGLGLYDRFGLLVMNQGFPPGIARFIEERYLFMSFSVADPFTVRTDDHLSPEPAWLPGLHSEMQYIYSACIFPIRDVGNFGIHYTYLTTGTSEVRNAQGEYIGEYESYDLAAGLSYGARLWNRLGVGISAKYIYSYLVPDWVWRELPELGIDRGGTAQSFALDLGVLYRIWGIGAGVSMQNIGRDIHYTETGSKDRLPTRIRWGVSYDPVVALDSILSTAEHKPPLGISSFFDFTIAYDMSYDFVDLDDSWESFGFEATFFSIFSYRYGRFQDDMGGRRGKTWGFGFNLRNIEIDIAEDSDIYDFRSENWRVQMTVHAIEPPAKLKTNDELHKILTVSSAALAPGGGQFYKGEGIKGALFFVPSLYLGHHYYKTESNGAKTWALVGLAVLYVSSAIEALLD